MNFEHFSPSTPAERPPEERAALDAHMREMLNRIEAALPDGARDEHAREKAASATHEYLLGLLEEMRVNDPDVPTKISASDAADTESPIMRYLIGEVSRTIGTRLAWRRAQLNAAHTDEARAAAETNFTDGMQALILSLLRKFRPPRPVDYGRPTQPSAQI